MKIVGLSVAAKNEHALQVAEHWKPKITAFFEFLKRAAIVAALKAASSHSIALFALYLAALMALILPIMWWADRFVIGFRGRGPNRPSARQIRVLAVTARALTLALSIGAAAAANLLCGHLVAALGAKAH